LERQVEALAAVREWRSEPAWLATSQTRDLFRSEYFRHLLAAEGADIAGGGFLKMRGDETDALVLLFFLRDISAEYGIRAVWKDEENPLLKLRFLEFRHGLLPTGQTLEDHFAKRPVIKKVAGQAITLLSARLSGPLQRHRQRPLGVLPPRAACLRAKPVGSRAGSP